MTWKKSTSKVHLLGLSGAMCYGWSYSCQFLLHDLRTKYKKCKNLGFIFKMC